jgi:membrane-bound ClpP family serine protease
MFLSKEITSTVDENHNIGFKIGEQGNTISRLAPMGKARFADKYVEVSSWDGFVDPNVAVEIVQIIDNTIYVSPVKTS